MGGANQAISAGVGGFLAFFLLAVALWLLMRNMSTRLRNVRFAEEQEDARRAAEAGDDVVVRPARRQVFLPVRDDVVPTSASSDPSATAVSNSDPKERGRDDASSPPAASPPNASEA